MTTQRNMDSFGPNELAIPELKLVQATGGELAKAAGAKPGDLWMNLYDKVIPGAAGMEMILVDTRDTRTFWGRAEIDNDPPVCSSDNAHSMIAQDGTDCKTCEHRCDTPWLLDAVARRSKCLLNFVLMGIKADDESPFVIRAGGTSAKSVRELMTLLIGNRQLKREYHKAIIVVSSEKRKSPSGESFAFKFRLKSLITDPERAGQMLQLTNQLLGGNMALPPADQDDLPQVEEQKQIAAPQEGTASAPVAVAEAQPNMDF